MSRMYRVNQMEEVFMKAHKCKWSSVLAVGATLVIAALVAGCGGSDGSSDANSSGNNSSADVKVGGTLRFGLESEPETLNPPYEFQWQESFITPQINETLFQVDSEGGIEPKLATKWQESDDHLTWTISLRKGVKFTNGAPLTADDVVFTIEKILDGPYYAESYEQIKKAKAANPTTVVIELDEPMPALLANFALFTSGIVPKDFGGASEEEFSQNPVGTGPFVLASWRHGRNLTLTKNPDYWNPKQPLLDEIVYTVTTSETARVAQLRGGDIDMTRVSPIGVKAGLSEAPEVEFLEAAGQQTNFLNLNSNWPPFNDPRLRAAANLALDREGINQAASDGKGTFGAGYLPPPINYFDPSLQPPDRDLSEAKKLVEEAVEDGVDPSFVLKFSNFSEFFTITAQIVQQNLEEVGFDVQVEQLDAAALHESSSSGKGVPATLDTSGAWSIDASELVAFYPFTAEHNGSNMKKLTAIADKAAVETDPEKRKQLYYEWQEVQANEELVLMLDYEPSIYATHNLTGIEMTPSGLITLAGVGLTN